MRTATTTTTTKRISAAPGLRTQAMVQLLAYLVTGFEALEQGQQLVRQYA
jgi:hypothetical protein